MRYHCLRGRTAVSTSRNDDIGLLMRAVCLVVRSSSRTTNGGGGDQEEAQRERKAHGPKWRGHNMAKHIAWEDCCSRRVQGLVFILYNVPLPHLVDIPLRSSFRTRILNMGVVSSCCESCCEWLFFSNFNGFSISRLC